MAKKYYDLNAKYYKPDGVGNYQDVLNLGLERAMEKRYHEKQQEREFGQQVALQQYQNEWNYQHTKPQTAMRDMIAAGINPLVAAEHVSGASSSSAVGGVPSSTNQIPHTIEAFNDAAQTMFSGAKNIADTISTVKKLDPEIKNIEADTSKKLAEYGLTNEQIYAWQVDNKYKDQNAQVDLRTKLLNEKNVAKQWDVLHAQYELMTTQLDTELAKQKDLYERAKLSVSQVGLVEAQAAYFAALKAKTDYEADFAKVRIDWWRTQGYDILQSSADAIMVQRLENGFDNEDIIREWSNYYGERAKAAYNAEPHNEEVRILYDNRNKASDLLQEMKENIKLASKLVRDGSMSRDEYDRFYNASMERISQIEQLIDIYDNAWRDDDYIRGYRKQYEDMLNNIVPFGFGAVLTRGASPKQVKGFKRY